MIPPCYNRPAYTEGRWMRTGRMRVNLTAPWPEPAAKPVWRWVPRWFADRCATHDGRGIGPNGESYPEAHGWDCAGCRWEPDHVRQRREFDARMAGRTPPVLNIGTPSGYRPLFERLLQEAKREPWWAGLSDMVVDKSVRKLEVIHSRPSPGSIHPDDE